MRLASFDIGIKNLAYCVFDIDTNTKTWSVVAWNVVNLLEDTITTPQNQKNKDAVIEKHCTSILQKSAAASKTKKRDFNTITSSSSSTNSSTSGSTICSKKAKYMAPTNDNENTNPNNNQKNNTNNGTPCFCNQHALLQQQYWLPKKEYTFAFLKGRSAGELRQICEQRGLSYGKSKDEAVAHLLDFYQSRVLVDVSSDQTKNTQTQTQTNTNTNTNTTKKGNNNNADTVTLIALGRAICRFFQAQQDIFGSVTHVIMENQISTLASRMKTIQGMIAQQFLMQEMMSNHPLEMEFVSSRNKLKGYVLPSACEATKTNTTTTTQSEATKTKTKTTTEAAEHGANNPARQASTYKNHKKDGIAICVQFIEANLFLQQNYKSMFQHSKKKDDLADCFLQGIWYLKSAPRSVIRLCKNENQIENQIENENENQNQNQNEETQIHTQIHTLYHSGPSDRETASKKNLEHSADNFIIKII